MTAPPIIGNSEEAAHDWAMRELEMTLSDDERRTLMSMRFIKPFHADVPTTLRETLRLRGLIEDAGDGRFQVTEDGRTALAMAARECLQQVKE